MNRTIKVAIVSLLACLIAVSVGTVAAVNGNQDGDVNRTEVRQQFRDENCCEMKLTLNSNNTQHRSNLEMEHALRLEKHVNQHSRELKNDYEMEHATTAKLQQINLKKVTKNN